jgi:L-lactate dehydrogenase (cytochrome)/(S)-mandelate dehydrogenase
MFRQSDWRKRAYSIDAVRDMARSVLPRPVFDFADGGAEDELTLQANEQTFDDYPLISRPLRSAASRDQSIQLFGRQLSQPVIVGPTGLSGLFHPDGECGAARAAASRGTAFCLSHGSVCTLEALAETTASPRWMQVFVYSERDFTAELIERATQASYDALVLTIDNQLIGQRERDIRNGFTIPPSFSVADTIAMATRLRWLARMRTHLPKITFGNYGRFAEPTGTDAGKSGCSSTSNAAANAAPVSLKGIAALMPKLLDPSMSWDDVRWVRELWNGPLIIKGILHPDDALKAIDLGVDGVIISNHGGRQLDGAVATARMLPLVADAVDGRIPVLLDGGVRRGRDVLIALALGATACLIARPQLWGLSIAGQQGVERVLDIYRDELDRAMGLCGLKSVSEIDRSLLFDPNQQGE